MPRSDSGPELELRRHLHALGVRYRLRQPELPGRPDILLTRARIACFVDGCFWHACPDHGTLPKNNRHWWELKLAATRERDRRKDRDLAALGWLPIHVWEHEDMALAAATVAALWKARTPQPPVRPRTT